ncbi:MAG: NHLP family bacteriocin export ABC transporter peptidase/permease/ATPase subunit [Anaerocolumna sp.]
MEIVHELAGNKKRHFSKRSHIKTPTVFQMEMTECGAASLSMIMQYYGVYISLDQLRIDTGVSRDGCKASKILQGARKYGFKTKGYKTNLEDLFSLKPPCIIHWNFNHFMVYEGISRGHVYMNDPAEGKRKLSIEEFDEGFTGIVLIIEPAAEVIKVKNNHSLIHFALAGLKGQYSVIAYLIFMGLLLVVPGMLTPVFTQIFIDDILIEGNISWIKTLFVAMITVSVLQAVFTFYRNLVLVRLQNKMALVSGYRFLYHLFCLPVEFFSQRYAGDLGDRVENNNSISEFLGGELAKSVLNVMISLFYVILLFLYSPLLTGISIVVMGMYFLISKSTSDVFSRTIMKMQQDQGKLIGVVVSGVSIMSTLKASGIENEYVGRVLGYYAKAIGEKQKYQKLQIVMGEMSVIVKQLCNVAVLIIGGCLVIKGNMTTGTLVAYCLLLGYFLTPVSELVTFGQKIQKIKADMNRVEDILHYNTDSKFNLEADTLELKSKLTGKILMEKVAFGYSILEKPLITDFNFNLNSGKSIALVGSSGSGKSTISKLLSGLYQPWEGKILFDDIQMNHIPKEIINSSIATVSQEISIFTGSIKDNITMWNKAIRDEDIIRAAKDAVIHDMITKKTGAYDYYLEEGGKNLSGGQKQRLEIARALVMNPTILILDEATSALDSITEKEIVDNIKRRGCTCVIVAHRLSAIRDCDEIVVMEQGKIIQRGTHNNLAAVPGQYRDLFVDNP